MSQLTAFNNKQATKDKYLKRVKAHYEADEIEKGYYWENDKGCAVGCTIEGSDHSKYETQLGIPKEIAYLEDMLFEALPNGDAKQFPLRFLEAITPGADLSLIVSKFVVWQFEDKKYGLKNIKGVKDNTEVYGFCEEVVALYKRKIAGDIPSEKEFYDLFVKIDNSGAWAGAGAGAEAGAGAWARAGAWAGAGAGAGFDKTYAEYIKVAADKLIGLLQEAK